MYIGKPGGEEKRIDSILCYYPGLHDEQGGGAYGKKLQRKRRYQLGTQWHKVQAIKGEEATARRKKKKNR